MLRAKTAPREFLLLTGLAGAGRSTAAAALARDGWTVLHGTSVSVGELLDVLELRLSGKVAICAAPSALPEPATLLADSALRGAHVLYLEASADTLASRFQYEHRTHPEPDPVTPGLSAALRYEEARSQAWRAAADLIVDTTNHDPQQLQRRISAFANQYDSRTRADIRPAVTLLTFGFKWGTPQDLTALFDVRSLPNPYWRDDLRLLGGTAPPVKKFLRAQHGFTELTDPIFNYLLLASQKKSSTSGHNNGADVACSAAGSTLNRSTPEVVAGIACTGGRHRSVAVAEFLAERLGAHDVNVAVHHRDVDR